MYIKLTFLISTIQKRKNLYSQLSSVFLFKPYYASQEERHNISANEHYYQFHPKLDF